MLISLDSEIRSSVYAAAAVGCKQDSEVAERIIKLLLPTRDDIGMEPSEEESLFDAVTGSVGSEDSSSIPLQQSQFAGSSSSQGVSRGNAMVGEFFKRMTKMESSLHLQTEELQSTRRLFTQTNDNLKHELREAREELARLQVQHDANAKLTKELKMNLRIEKNRVSDLEQELKLAQEVNRRAGKTSHHVSPVVSFISTRFQYFYLCLYT